MKKLEFLWLRKLERKHLLLMLDMWTKMVEEDNNNGFLSERTIEDYYFRRLANDVEEGLKRLLVIKDEEGKYLGQLVLNLFHQDTYGHRADVSSLMLLKEARDAKTSMEIANCLIEKCESLHLDIITIDVRGGTSQERLWKYLGFEIYGKMPFYSKVQEDTYHGIFMYQKVETMKSLMRDRLSGMYAKDKTLAYDN